MPRILQPRIYFGNVRLFGRVRRRSCVRNIGIASYFSQIASNRVTLARQHMDLAVLRWASFKSPVECQSLPMICSYSQKVQDQTPHTRLERVLAHLCQAVMEFHADARIQIFRTPCHV